MSTKHAVAALLLYSKKNCKGFGSRLANLAIVVAPEYNIGGPQSRSRRPERRQSDASSIEIGIVTRFYLLNNQESFSDQSGYLVYVTSMLSLPFVE
jgi:hypothetical protein